LKRRRSFVNTPFFELKNVSKYFARVVANKDISFSVNRGRGAGTIGRKRGRKKHGYEDPLWPLQGR
jgi:ABC-type phosphonate transport system ATPase subunit